jgi:selenocysteine lyase/cysteine desulfurase
LLAALEGAAKPMPKADTWDAVRKLFTLSPDWMHFSGFFIASHPAPVREAIEAYRRAIDENPFTTVEEGLFQREGKSVQDRVRDDIAAYLGGKGDDVALVSNTTSGLALVYSGLPLKPGDEVLTTTHDHYVHHTAINLAVKRNGAAVRKVALYDDSAKATVNGIVERVRREVRPATRVLGITWVSSQTGLKLPVKQIAAAIADINQRRAADERVVLLVDGVHGLGCADATVAELGADVFVAGTHKWMFGPRGTGIVWAKPEVWARMTPSIPSFGDPEQFQAWAENREPRTPATAARMSPGGFLAYEHQWALSSAFRLHRELGRDRIAGRVSELNGQIKDALVKIPGLTLFTPRDPQLSAGICSFVIKGRDTDAIVDGLRARRVIASHSPYRPSYPRLSAGIFNTPTEVVAAVEALRAVVGV